MRERSADDQKTCYGMCSLFANNYKYRLLTAVLFIGQVSTVIVSITHLVLWNTVVVSALERAR